MRFTRKHILAQTSNVVELHPGMDLWMRGARFGQVEMVSTCGKFAKLRMANKRVKRLVVVNLDDCKIHPFATIY